ncbi:hypothetical protein ABE073_04445 [Lederbergia citrisecunda]|uniref:hypothetical protein n=1 Tax=Lederbergia citrisecunda TaxID=2833583 RepID=UPI003D2A7B07
MNRYLVFGFHDYYPGGGMKDCKLKTNELNEVIEFVKMWEGKDKDSNYEHLHVYDGERDEVIYEARFDINDYFDNNARDLVLKIRNIY